MTMELKILDEFGLVVLVLVASFIANIYMAFGVDAARSKYKVFYPTMYAVESETKEAKVFNYIQRGHQNYLEVVPFFLAYLVLAGLQRPRIATVTGIIFLAARCQCFKAYSTGDPKKRLFSVRLGYACVLVLLGCNISFVVRLYFLR